jgi:hypothetical protein
MERWQSFAGVYVASVALASILNQVADPDVVGWYLASVILTLPLSPFAIYPTLFLADAVGQASVGDSQTGNVYSSAVVVIASSALALVNVAMVRFVALRKKSGRRHERGGSQATSAH